MGAILIIGEHEAGKVKKTTLELASKAAALAAGDVVAAFIGSGLTGCGTELGAYGVKKVFNLNHAALAQYSSEGYTMVVADLVGELKPTVVLATASPAGVDFMPRLAARLQTGLATDCTDLRLDGGTLVAVRPVYAGKSIIEVRFKAIPALATTRPNSFATVVASAGTKAEVIAKEIDPGTIRAVVKEVIKGKSEKPDLTEAEIIVSGGRSIGSGENFKILNELADVIGATVGASRAAVDSGYCPHDMQVGQTGKTVNPKLYIAFGISGAIQHLAGMKTSKVIVAINKDAEAPIFQKADYGIVDDLFKGLPALTAEFRKLLAE